MASKDPMLRHLGDFLRKTREELGWSQEDLAYESGLHRTYVGAVERGEYNLTLLTLRKITDALGISLSDAIGSIPQRKPRRR
ncbi:MAG TPA: helix-turn-helix transcriptional regulator [Phycisphaerae bacterium]|nr:helix-turn-helix transcriptional regulator [Phycisphaerae bacterium]